MTVRLARGLAALALALALAGCDRLGLGNDAAGQAGSAPANAANQAAPAEAANASAAKGTAAPAAEQVARNGGEYVALAAAADRFEIEAAELALDRARAVPVRQLAEAILADHRRATGELRTISRRLQPPVDFDPELSAAHRQQLALLRRAEPGARFEEEWLFQQMSAHEAAMTLHTAFAAGGGPEAPALAAHAAGMAAIVQQHLSRIRSQLERPPAG